MEITGITLILIGLGVATYGAYVIYRADFPRNNWIVEAMNSAASKPSYGLISTDDYNPDLEREQALARTQEVIKQTESYAKTSRRGMLAIGLGFIFQALGNILLLWPLVSKASVS
jgi:hypothetical protein